MFPLTIFQRGVYQIRRTTRPKENPIEPSWQSGLVQFDDAF